MSAPYTTGPWRVAPEAFHPWLVECATKFPGVHGHVCVVGYRPNAYLIAAAPDMLAALRAVVAVFGSVAGEIHDGALAEAEVAAMEEARAAIAKAVPTS
jgi:hypothetical protein